MTIATTPKPPYYAAIFSSFATGADADGHGQAAVQMVELAMKQPGFIGFEYGDPRADKFSLFVSYWRSDADIRAWKQVADHLAIQEKGKSAWYSSYRIRIAKVERDYGRD
ncbi:MAG TPA: antibiotic biosynthesis monooxygenase [Hyphomonadaceae bacterium]|nr:antibiotic biosynthesis monooxygenase [Hyphomonadaceae bacterium]